MKLKEFIKEHKVEIGLTAAGIVTCGMAFVTLGKIRKVRCSNGKIDELFDEAMKGVEKSGKKPWDLPIPNIDVDDLEFDGYWKDPSSKHTLASFETTIKNVGKAIKEIGKDNSKGDDTPIWILVEFPE